MYTCLFYFSHPNTQCNVEIRKGNHQKMNTLTSMVLILHCLHNMVRLDLNLLKSVLQSLFMGNASMNIQLCLIGMSMILTFVSQAIHMLKIYSFTEITNLLQDALKHNMRSYKAHVPRMLA